jgi:multiple sugar transport system permease protein
MAQVQSTESAPGRGRFLLDDGRFVGVLFLVPSMLYIILLVAFPFVLAIGFSFSDVTVGNTSLDFNGFDNFVSAWENPIFRKVLVNTFFFTFVSQIFILIFANILAVIYLQDFTGKWFARFLFILPWATPVSLAMIGWLWLFDTEYSSIDYALLQLGLLGRNGVWGPDRNLYWLANPTLAQVSVIFVQVWRFTPLATVILMAGLSSIPSDIIDQAQVDGSRFLRTLLEIKLPLILPIMIIALLFSIITMFGDMTVYYVLTGGRPIDYTRVIGLYAFEVGIEGGNLGEGAAMSLFAFPLMLALAIVLLRMASRAEVQ